MSIEVACVQCGSTHQVNDRLAGRRVRCPNCDSAVHVPELNIDTTGEATEAVEADAGQPVEVEPALPVTAVPETAATSGVVSEGLEVNVASEPPQTVSEQTGAESVDEEEDVDQVLPRSNRPEQEMDMTPMVDVTFLLLIFFMVTAAFSFQKSIKVPRQQTDAPSTSVVDEETEELDMVEVQVDEFGGFLVMAPEWERETPGKQNLITALKEAIAGSSAGMRLVVKVHELAKLHALVDAMDAGTIAGYAELQVTQVEDFD